MIFLNLISLTGKIFKEKFMTFFEAIFLGFLQGATEFLPV
jgi:hypothetical protein